MAVEHQTQSGIETVAISEAPVVPAATAATSSSPTVPQPRRPTRLRIKPEAVEPVSPWQELLRPASIRGWAFSLTVHLLALFAFALIVLKPPPPPPSPLDTRLLAGDEHGSELGEKLQGGLGIDLPLTLPGARVTFPESSPTLTDSKISAQTPALSTTTPQARDRDGGQEGVALTGTGQGGNGEGFGVAKFGHGGERINDVEVQVGNPQFTLIWDSRADLDLHVLEPGGSHLFWEHRDGELGGKLDVDDVDGFGPENIFWGEEIGQDNGPPGEYKWFVHYYGAIGGIAVPTHWKMRLKHNGKFTVFEGKLNRIGQQSRTYAFAIDGETAAEAHAPEALAANGKKAAPDLDARRKALFAPPDALIPERDAGGWVIVEPAGAGFRARMPEPPTIERYAANSPRLGDLEIHSYTVDRGLGGYIITYADLPPSALKDGPDAVLDTEAKAAAADLIERGATPFEDRSIVSGTHPGRAFSFSVSDRIVAGGGTARVRVFLAGDRLFTATVVGQKDFVARPDTDKFLDAFQIIERH